MQLSVSQYCAAAFVAIGATLASPSAALAQFDYASSLGTEFKATFPGGDPGAGAPSSPTFGDWALRGPDGTPASLAAFDSGLPASGQPGWDANPTQGAPYTYFGTQWQPGVTVDPRVAGHGKHDVLWTAPASVNSGGVELRGAMEQLFESARVQRLKVFKNGAATPAYTVDSKPPIVDGVVLQKVAIGPVTIAVVPGDTLKFFIDGSGAGGNGVSTFVAWDVQLTEVFAPVNVHYTSSLASEFLATFPGGDPAAGAPSSATFGDWALRGPDGTPASLAAFPGGLPASGQAGWDANPTQGAPYTYFGAQWQPGVTVDPRIAGHAQHDVLWTAPPSVNSGGVELRGAIEQIFEGARVQRLSIFKNGDATPVYTVDSKPPIVDAVVLQKVDIGPVTIPVAPGDTLQFFIDGSGTGGNGVGTFVAWDVQLTEVVVPGAAGPADFDDSGKVDAADLAQWRDDFGVNGDSDADGDNDSDGADFLAWQRDFGRGAGGGGAIAGEGSTGVVFSLREVAGADAAIPEPAAASLLALGVLLATHRRAGVH